MICLAHGTSVNGVEGPSPRLCIIRTWPDFKGYGFNLQAEEGRKGHFIGRVDAGSPAEAAGLRPGDSIIEVNDANVQSEIHSKVVSRIRSNVDTVRLLAVEPTEEKYFSSRGIIINSQMPNIVVGDAGDRSRISRTSEMAEASVVSSSEVEEISQCEEPGRCNSIGETQPALHAAVLLTQTFHQLWAHCSCKEKGLPLTPVE